MSRFMGATTVEGRIRDLELKVEALQRRTPSAISFADANRRRVRIGEDPDSGKFGVWVWNSGGGLIFEQSS